MNRRKKEHSSDSSIARSRRGFISGICGVALGAAAGALLVALPGSASAALAGEGATREVLYIEGVAAGLMTSHEGGTPFVETRVIPTPEPPFFRNVVGTVRTEPITLKFGSGLSGSLYQWVQEALHPKTMLNRKSGHLAFVDSDSKETGRVNFFDALISEITLPAFDLASRDVAALTIKLAPQGTQLQMGTGSTVPVGATSVKAGVIWGANGFAVTIDGGAGQQIATNTVLAVEPHTTSFKVADPGQERVGTQVLPLPGPLVLIVREDGARQYIDWFNQLWGGPQTDPDSQQQNLRTLTLSFVRRDLMTGSIVATYGTATFHQVGISRVSPVPFQGNDRWRKVKVELYASALTLDIKGFAGT